MSKKKVASIAISASVVAGGIGVPTTMAYAQTLPSSSPNVEQTTSSSSEVASSTQSLTIMLNSNIVNKVGNNTIANVNINSTNYTIKLVNGQTEYKINNVVKEDIYSVSVNIDGCNQFRETTSSTTIYANMTEVSMNFDGNQWIANAVQRSIGGESLTYFNVRQYADTHGGLNIDLTGDGLTNLNGMQNLKGIDIASLNLSNNDIASLSSLSGLTIGSLNVSNNNLTDLIGVESIQGLKSLNAESNYISNASCLLNMHDLEYVNLSENLLSNNNLTDISGISSTGLDNNFIEGQSNQLQLKFTGGNNKATVGSIENINPNDLELVSDDGNLISHYSKLITMKANSVLSKVDNGYKVEKTGLGEVVARIAGVNNSKGTAKVSVKGEYQNNTLNVRVADLSGKVVASKDYKVIENGKTTNVSGLVPKGYKVVSVTVNGNVDGSSIVNSIPNDSKGQVLVRVTAENQTVKVNVYNEDTGKLIGVKDVTYKVNDNVDFKTAILKNGYEYNKTTNNGNIVSGGVLSGSEIGQVNVYLTPVRINAQVECNGVVIESSEVTESTDGTVNDMSNLVPKGYTLTSLRVNGVTVSNSEIKNIPNGSENVVINVEPIVSTVTVKYVDNDGVAIKTVKQEVEYGKDVKVSPLKGYNIVSVNGTTSDIKTGEVVTAKVSPIDYKVDLTYVCNGKVIKRVTDTCTDGKVFNVMDGMNDYNYVSSTAGQENFKVSENLQVTVNVSPKEYRVVYRVECNGQDLKGGMTTVSPNGTGKITDILESNVIPTGYEFSSATVNGKSVTENALEHMTGNSAQTVIINVNKKTYDFSYTFKESNGKVIKSSDIKYKVGNSVVNLEALVPNGYRVVGGENLTDYNMFGHKSLTVMVETITHKVEYEVINSITNKVIVTGTHEVSEVGKKFNAMSVVPNGYVYVGSRLDGVNSTQSDIRSLSNKENSSVVIAVENSSDVGRVTASTNESARTVTFTYNNPNAKTVELEVGSDSANMTNEGNGVWTITSYIPNTGSELLYKFKVNGQTEVGHGVMSIDGDDVFTYTAITNELTYDVTCNGKTVNGGKLSVENGGGVSNLSEVIPSGYKFVSATVNGEPISQEDLSSIPDSASSTVSIVVEPAYNKLSYKVECKGKTLLYDSAEVNNTKDTTSLSDVIPNGYKFSSATVNGKSVSENELSSITNSQNSDVVINVTPIEYTANVNVYNDETGKLIKTEKLSYNVAETINLTKACGVTGYTFKVAQNDGVVLGGSNVTHFPGSEIGTLNVYMTPNVNYLTVKVETGTKTLSTKVFKVANGKGTTSLKDLVPTGYSVKTLCINGTYVNVDRLGSIPNSDYGEVVIKVAPIEYSLNLVNEANGKSVSKDTVYEISTNGKCNYSTLIPYGYKVVGIEINGNRTNDSVKDIPVGAGNVTVELDCLLRTNNIEVKDGSQVIENFSTQHLNTGTSDVVGNVAQGYKIVSATDNGVEVSATDLTKISNVGNNNVVIDVKPISYTIKIPVYDSQNGWIITTETVKANVEKQLNIKDIAKVKGYEFDYITNNGQELNDVKSITGVGMGNLAIYLTPIQHKATVKYVTSDGHTLMTKTITGSTTEEENVIESVPTGYTSYKVTNDGKELASKQYDNGMTLGSMDNVVVYVNKSEYRVPVKFYNSITGKLIETKDLTYTYGQKINMTEFSEVNGYTFDYLENNGEQLVGEDLNQFNATRWIHNNLSVYLTPNTMTQSIKWVNEYNGKTVKTSKVTGSSSEMIDINSMCPTGYKIVSVNNYGTATSDGNIELSQIDDMSIQVRPIETIMSVTWMNGNSEVEQKIYSGEGSQTKDLMNAVPQGYHIVSVVANGKTVNPNELKSMDLSSGNVTIELERKSTKLDIKCVDANTGKTVYQTTMKTNKANVDLSNDIPNGYQVTSVMLGGKEVTESSLTDVSTDVGQVLIKVQPKSMTGTVDTTYSNGKLDVEFVDDTATEVSLNANVNGWKVTNMKDEGNGVWETSVDVPSGVDSVSYNFKVDNYNWTNGQGVRTSDGYDIYRIAQNDEQGDVRVSALGNGNVKVEYGNTNAKSVSIHYELDGQWYTKSMTNSDGVYSIEVPLSPTSTSLNYKFIVNGEDWVVASGADTVGSGVYKTNVYRYGESAFSKDLTARPNGESMLILSQPSRAKATANVVQEVALHDHVDKSLTGIVRGVAKWLGI